MLSPAELNPAALYGLVVALGLLVGSFLNVVILRLPERLFHDWRCQCRELLDIEASDEDPPPGIALGRSRCRSCGTQIRAYDNIPLVSWLLLRGRCRECGAAISTRYPLVEAFTALMSARNEPYRPASLVLMFQVTVQEAALGSLASLVSEHVSYGIPPRDRRRSCQVMISAAGFRALGCEPKGLRREVLQGIAAPHRSRALGDLEANDPDHWHWCDDVHLVLWVYGSDWTTVQDYRDELCALATGMTLGRQIATRLPEDRREPFGFLDGIGKMQIDLGDGGSPTENVAVMPAGEVLLGFPDQTGACAPVPDLCRNGAYVVLRQLEQDVAGFWKFWRDRAQDDTEAVWLAAKAVGRWPNGMPVSGAKPTPEPAFDQNIVVAPISFADDPHGNRCPLGAHIRRANPRDGMGDDPTRSLAITAAHRLFRKGRNYGPPTPAEWLPEGLGAVATGSVPEGEPTARGLFFACLCSDIGRQFEFVQQTWLNNPKHADLFGEIDPISPGRGIRADEHLFTIPRNPSARRFPDLQTFVTVRGGGYFLLPGRRVLLELTGSS